MRKKVILILIGSVLALIAYRIAIFGTEEPAMSITDYQEADGIPVEVAPAEFRTMSEVANFTGTLEGSSQTDALAGATAEIEKIHVRVGDRVRQGQLLADVTASNADLRQSQSALMLSDAVRNLERMRELRDSGAISEQSFEKIKMNYDLAKSNYSASREGIEIDAPIDGVITHVFVELGQTVFQNNATFRVATLDTMQIPVAITEGYISKIAPDLTAVINTAAYPEETFAGRVDRVSLSADPKTRTFEVIVSLPNPGLKLRPGMFAEVAIVLLRHTDAVAIPGAAIFLEAGSSYAYVIGDDNIARKTSLQIGIQDELYAEIISGIAAGESVVVSGVRNLKDATLVRIIE